MAAHGGIMISAKNHNTNQNTKYLNTSHNSYIYLNNQSRAQHKKIQVAYREVFIEY